MSRQTQLLPPARRRPATRQSARRQRMPSGPAALLAVALLFPAIAARAAEPPPLGRLFNTPQQRAQLDAQRHGAVQPAAPSEAAQPPSAPPPPPPPLVLNGVLRPTHGKATVWLNQQPVPDGQRVLRRDGMVTLILPSGRRVTLKPGQRYDETTGEVRDDSH